MAPRTPRRRPAVRLGVPVLGIVVLLAPFVLGALALETRPRVADAGPPDAATAALTRDLAEGLAVVAAAGGPVVWEAEEAGLNAGLASLRRVAPGLRGAARIADGRAALDLSVGAPHLPEGLWANLHLALGASDEGLDVRVARIGRLPLPPGLVAPVAERVLDWKLGPGSGETLLGAVRGVVVDAPRVTVRLDLDPADRERLIDRARGRLQAMAGASNTHAVQVQLYYLDKGARAGSLPGEGSMLPYLGAVVREALREGEGPAPGRLRAGFLALALYCGHEAIGPAIGVGLPERMQGARNRCDGATLKGRDDLKRHFVLSAAIEAAQTGASAPGVGEMKELLDMNAGGTGFSFDDMAANLAGARFAATFLGAPPADWRDMLEGVARQADVLPSLGGLPRGMDEAAFREAYGDVDSAAYAALLAEIAGRVAALPLHGDRAVN